MKVFILLFPFIVVACQAYQLPLKRRLQAVRRQEDPETNESSVNGEFYETRKKFAKTYMLDGAVYPDLPTHLVPDVYKPSYLRLRGPILSRPHVNGRITNPAANHFYPNPVLSHVRNPAVHSRILIDESANDERGARLARIDKEALSKMSDEDREILVSKLSLTEREALLIKLENGQLDDLLPREENRFGGLSSAMSGGVSAIAAQIGASAGSYIGGKLAGSLGAKLGTAAGAYLGAAAASRLIKKFTLSDNPPPSQNNVHGYLGHNSGFGAVMVNTRNK